MLACGLVTSSSIAWLCRLGLLDRGSIWPWFGSTGVGSCRVFLAFPMFQNKLHGFSLHQLHPKYLLLQFSRTQQPLWQCYWASVPSHTSKIRRTNMKANLPIERKQSCFWVYISEFLLTACLAYISWRNVAKFGRKINLRGGKKLHQITKKEQKQLKMLAVAWVIR